MTRWRSSAKPARPYICRFKILNLVLALDRAVAVGQAQPGDDGVEVLAQPADEGVQSG